MTKLSVVMATYNRAKILPLAIDSILGQTLTDFEFIIVDDGSTDDTADVLHQYAKHDKRICIFNPARMARCLSPRDLDELSANAESLHAPDKTDNASFSSVDGMVKYAIL